VPIFVRPKKGMATAKIAFLVPTFSYLAYGGTGNSGFNILSNYAHHTDGSGIGYSSLLRPITNMRPKISTRNPWQFMEDTYIIDWLEVKGFAADIITDQDLHFEGAALLAPYKAVITGSHPEYYSQPMMDGLHTYLEYPNGGAVLSTGSIAWCASLSYNNYTNNVSRLTENVLRRFASDVPLPPPSTSRPTSQSANRR